MDEYSTALLRAVDDAVPRWVERCVRSVASAQGIPIDPSGDAAIRAAAAQARAEVVERLTALLSLDVDDQRGNPLDLVRRAVRYPTEVLRGMGAAPVRRDEFAERMFPDDVYGLSPAAFADVDESLTEPGIVWGAWKAATVLARRRAEGRLDD